jgi:hypothetical protein
LKKLQKEKCDFVRDAEHEHGKESEAHCVDTHVDDEIEVEDENETTFAAVEKCEENLAMEVVEDINEATVNVEFYVELAFLEEWLAKPKYDGDESGYGKVVITAAEEEPIKRKPSKLLKVIAGSGRGDERK